jgi:uncharacterized protein YeaO (DUF488 family)
LTDSLIQIRRAYEAPAAGDGVRYLVDRLWPRGVRRESLLIAAWLRDAAPSSGLCKWFNHDPALWEEFKQRYFEELEQHPAGWQELLQAARERRITLVYGARDVQHNNAAALKQFLDQKLRESTIP